AVPGCCLRRRLHLLLAHLLPSGCARRGAGRLFAGRRPHRAAGRIDAPLVTDDDAGLLTVRPAHRRSVSSSTISASTTSSSPPAAVPVAPAEPSSPVGPAAPAVPALSAWACA